LCSKSKIKKKKRKGKEKKRNIDNDLAVLPSHDIQVLVVHPDFYWVLGSFQKVPLLF